MTTDQSTIIERYIEQLLRDSKPEAPSWNMEQILLGKKPSWNYIDGCMLTTFLELYRFTGDRKYLSFVDNFVDYYVQEDGSILTFDKNEFNLDNINEGKVLFRLFDLTQKEKYRLAQENLHQQLLEQPRTGEGNFWHKKIYPNQVWLDGLYMAQPFYLEYLMRAGDQGKIEDIYSQFLIVRDKMKDPRTGLFYHAYDQSREMFWCDPKTGLSKHFWLRALGWFLMAMIDILEIFGEAEHPLKDLCGQMFSELVDSLIQYQDESGMWYQVADMGYRESNYLETSGSSIIAYGIAKGVYMKKLPAKYLHIASKAFGSICDKYLYEKDGQLNLGGICLVAGLGGADRRDGSFEYYMSEPVVENEAKGIAPFLLAYVYLQYALNGSANSVG